MSKRVAIIGGGFSGLAAGVELAELGVEVLLVERRNNLGGRAYSFVDSGTGATIDNGQHLFMGCYRHTISFLKKIGCADRLEFQDRTRVDFLDGEAGPLRFSCPALPSPLHLLAGLLKLKGLTLGDKFRALKVARAITGKNSTGSMTVDDWLDQLEQSERIRRRFWYPMAIATLNEHPGVASARMLKRVLTEAFSGDRRNSSIGLARVGLSDLYVHAASDFIRSRSGDVRIGAEVRRLVVNNNSVVAAELRSGEKIEADRFISAVPPSAFLQMLDENTARHFRSVASLQASPIVSINLWFDRPVMNTDFAGLLGTHCQWVFNKDLIVSPNKNWNQLAVIISAARDFVDWTKDALVEMALADLRKLIPAIREARLIHSVIVKEREATMAHTVDSDQLRPGPWTPVKNLILAGDWTDTGLPATIESAVLSGHVAAECATGKKLVPPGSGAIGC